MTSLRHITFLILTGLFCLPATAQTLGFRQALSKARSSSPTLKVLKYNTGMAEADLITARTRQNLNLNNQTLQMVHPENFAKDTKFNQPQNRQVWWQLTKPVALNNQRHYKIEAARKSITVAEQNYMDAERSVLLEVGNKWLDVWYNKMTLDLAEQARRNVDTLSQTQQIRLKNEVISKADYTRTQLLLSQYNLQLKSAQQNYQNELLNLAFLTGTAVSGIDASDGVAEQVFSCTADSLVERALRQRPDVLAAQSSIEAAQANAILQRKLALPVPELGGIWNPQNTVPYAGIFATIQIPIFDRNQGAIRKARVSLEQARETLNGLQTQMQTEIQISCASYYVNKNIVEQYGDILDQSEDVLHSVQYAYTRGGTTIIDFLDAQRNWYDTRKLYYEALYNYRKSYLQLLFTTGIINQL
ncbi:MAG: TolC family protein [Chitinophagaceae bacterium]